MKTRLLPLLLLLAAACTKEPPKHIPSPDEMMGAGETPTPTVPVPTPTPGPDGKTDYPDRDGILQSHDMVLLYGGSHHRNPYTWDKEYMADYVRYVDKSGVHHWLFDAFLCLEFMWVDDTEGNPDRTFITGYSYNGKQLTSADKPYWEKLADYYFLKGCNLDALETAVATESAAAGKPSSKRKIIIGIPEPIEYKYSYSQSGGSTYWGTLDGKRLDFSNSEDRVAAVRWYIDRVRANFLAKNYANIELAGFYWVAEKATQTRDILSSVGSYLNSLGYSFNWIPYYTADGYASWSKLGFSQAFLQPNYFFNESIPYNRLTDAVSDATRAGMGLELEFDGKAAVSYGWGYRLRDYMKAFRDTGVWEKLPIAYYQGSWALRWLEYSSNEDDRQLYHDFCDFVVSRPLNN